jgi:hypothetical protein
MSYTVLGKLLGSVMLDTVVAAGIYLGLSLVRAVDSGFFAAISGVAVCIACWVSPGVDLRAGLRMLWLFDWFVAAFPPAISIVMSLNETAEIKGLRAIAVFLFALSGLVCIRRVTNRKEDRSRIDFR